jgi:uncharacterized protein YgiB involved in biofilm formation
MSKMKRTRQLALTTLMATASINLIACGQQSPEPLTWETPAGGAAADASAPVDALAYADPAACKAADDVPDADCDAGWATAQADHEANGPRYGDKAACEAEYGEGRCETRSGGSFFMPLLAGMVLGNVLGGRGGYRGAGLYRDRGGGFTTPFGGGLSRDPRTGRLQVARGAVDPAARAGAGLRSGSDRAVSRGGFRSTRSYAGRGYGG